MSHNDASRESTGAAVERSRSYPDGTKALTQPSVSRPVDLEAWERLARAAAVELEEVRGSQQWWSFMSLPRCGAAFAEFCTPERILGLIGEVRRSQSGQEQKQKDEG